MASAERHVGGPAAAAAEPRATCTRYSSNVNELADRAENALKIAGDVYVARLFGMTAARIGLEQWRGNVRES